MISYIQNEMEMCAEYSVLVRSESSSRQRLGFHQSKNNAISLRHTVQAEVLVKVVTGNKDDSQGEILSQKKKIRFEKKFVTFV